MLDGQDLVRLGQRLSAARVTAVALLEAAADHAGVWMHNLSTGARALVTHEDTLVRLLTEGWVHLEEGLHLAPEPATPVQPPTPSPELEAAPEAAEPPQAAPAAEVEIEAAPEETAVPDAPAPRGKKA